MPDTIRPTRADTWSVTVFVEHPVSGNMVNCGVWDRRTGGEVDSEETKYNPGGMAEPISLGGRRTVGNIVVARNYRLVRDHQDLAQFLTNAVGKSRMTVSAQPLDINGNSFGRPIVWHGTLKRFTPPEHDSEGSDAAMVELEMTPEGSPVV